MGVFFLSLAKIRILYYISNQFFIKFYSFYDSPYLKDAKYIYWLIENDPNFKVDILEILGIIPKNDSEAKKLLSEEYDRVFSQMAENVIMPFGKYKGKSLKEIEEQDPNYIDWLRKNNIDILGRK
ncbi:hypothetical protein BARVI_04530 [Barnesiella viscericola DSM 18177]|uniref:Exodeoxyribonuclease X-like C-terminal domain-containing protein n=1 Tax=Barnesiella viscericola DSM 18177 TaxID=880074 RepID=W0ESI6_9BACT|nr:hypothetical protein BARVI_04530 [Barnesiella viscericola DSM 18177]